MKAGGLHPVRCWHLGLPSAEHFILCQAVISKKHTLPCFASEGLDTQHPAVSSPRMCCILEGKKLHCTLKILPFCRSYFLSLFPFRSLWYLILFSGGRQRGLLDKCNAFIERVILRFQIAQSFFPSLHLLRGRESKCMRAEIISLFFNNCTHDVSCCQ